MTKEEKLEKIRFGRISAEDDDQLIGYFVETPVFEQILKGNKDIVVGRKGSGKSALFKILAEKQGLLKEINEKLLIPIHNPNKMFELNFIHESMKNEIENCRLLWCIFISFYVAKYLIEAPIASLIDSSDIKAVLAGTGMEDEILRRRPVLQWLRTMLGTPYFSVVSEGTEYRMGLQPPGPEQKRHLDLTRLLTVEDRLLSQNKREAWILIDRLDEVSLPSQPGIYQAQERAIVGLMNAYSDLRVFNNLKLKIFIRKDIYDSLQFANKDHFSDLKIEICWEPAHLKRLIAKRVQVSLYPKNHQDNFTDALAEEYFDIAFDKEIDYDEKKMCTFEWLLEQLSDGNDFISPRDFLNLSMKAQQRQLEYYKRGIHYPKTGLISQQAVCAGFKDASDDKLNDYLYGVFGHVKNNVENFKGIEKPILTIPEIKEILNISNEEDVYLILDELCNIGFLKKKGVKPTRKTEKFEVAPVYATALQITKK